VIRMTRLERTHKTPLRLQSCIRATIFGKAGWVEGGSILYSERPPDRWAVKGENPRNSSPRISFSNAMPHVSGGHLRGFAECGDVTECVLCLLGARAAQVCRSFSGGG